MGTLYVVATPIGNLGDFSPRAREQLQGCQLVVAEDTRHTSRLLDRALPRPRLMAMPAAQEEHRIPEILRQLELGDVALASDAGTPAISDPGRRLIAAARGAGHRVEAVPGPSAAITAIAGSGLRADRFLFLGFLPRTPGRARRLLESAGEWAMVFYESPHRLAATLAAAGPVLGERRVAVARELTKLHETWYFGTANQLSEALARQAIKGECTVVVESGDG